MYLLKKKGGCGVLGDGYAIPQHPTPRFIEKINTFAKNRLTK